MNILKHTVSKHTAPLIFAIGAFVFYGFFYENHLVQREQLQLFRFTGEYFAQKILVHGGFSDYAGEFLTQFFRFPLAGASIVTLLLMLLYILTKNITLWITSSVPAGTLALIPAAIYMVLLPDNYYYISGLVAVILALLAFIPCMKGKPGNFIVRAFIALPVIYWFTGGAVLVFASLLIAHQLTAGGKNILVLPVFAGWTILIPFAVRRFLFEDTLLQSFLSGSFYAIPVSFPLPLILLFASFPVVVLIQYFIGKLNGYSVVSDLVLTGILLAGFRIADFYGENVIKYENLVYEEKWEEIVMQAEEDNPSDPVSLTALNLALAHTKGLSSTMFSYPQREKSLFPDYERRGMTPFIASEPYYHLGFFNFARMFATETIESTPDAKFPSRSFRRVAETMLINGQYDAALKYLEPLSRTLFYSGWAKIYLGLVRSGEIENDEWLAGRRKMMTDHNFFYDPGRMDVSLKYLLASEISNKPAYEYLMAWYLLRKDLDGFLQGLSIAHQMGYGSMPVAWQEAGAYIGTRIGKIPDAFTGYGISDDVMDKLNAYAKAFSTEIKDTASIQREFGKTYWYYLHFR